MSVLLASKETGLSVKVTHVMSSAGHLPAALSELIEDDFCEPQSLLNAL